VGDADIDMELVEEGEEDSDAVCVGLAVGVVLGLVVIDGDGLQDPVIVAVRDVEGVGVELSEELAEADDDMVEDALELVEVVTDGEALVVLVGVGLGEGHTAHSAADGV
jgi:hypothetical protein